MNYEPQHSAESLVYGIHPVSELISTKIRNIDRIYFDKERSNAQLFEVVKLARKERLPYQMVPTLKLDQLCGSSKHQGAVAICTAVEYTTAEDLMTKLEKDNRPGLLVLPASIEDPRNLGALIRTCVAFNVDGLLLERKNTAPIGPTVAKTSAGMLEHLPLVKPKNLEGLVTDLAKKGFNIVGAEKGCSAKPQDIDFKKPTVIVMGGENRGIPPYLAKQCTHMVGIPISSRTPSLNVSVATAVFLYECARQREFDFGETASSNRIAGHK